jgi:hypothetical protein
MRVHIAPDGKTALERGDVAVYSYRVRFGGGTDLFEPEEPESRSEA